MVRFSPFGIFISLFLQQPFHLREEHWYLCLDRLPHQLVVEHVVPVDETVAERDDASMLAYASGRFGIVPGDASDRLAYDLQNPLHSLTEEPIAPIV